MFSLLKRASAALSLVAVCAALIAPAASATPPALSDQTPTWAKAAALAQEWELTRLAERLAELARTA